jgi:subtilisin family serine protease
MSRQHCLLILLLLVPFAAASAIVAATAKKKANRDNYEDQKPSIYLVSVHGEPSAAAFRQRGADDRNETWLREQKTTSVRLHDRLLRRAMDGVASSCCPTSKLYSFHHAVNGFAVHATASLAERLRAAPEVAAVEEDVGTRLMTTRTPRLLGLPGGVWKRRRDGEADDGERVVVGIVDSGVDPAHPSFAYAPRRGAWPFAGEACGVGPMFPPSSCNGKIVVARYFAAGAAAVLPLNASRDLSPFDAEGHGR